MTAQNGTTPPVVVTPAEIAAMLRKSAEIVERNEFHPILYQTMKVLTAYAGDYVDNTSTVGNVSGAVGNDQNKSAFHDVPDSVLDGPTSTATTTSAMHHNRNVPNASSGAGRPQSGGQYNTNNPAAVSSNISSGNSVSGASTVTSASKHKSAFSLKGIRKGLQKIGGDISELMEGHGKDDAAPFDENAWCEECFTRGCGCKQLRNKLADASTQQQIQSNTSAPVSNNSDHDKSSQPIKPCFQRPINPSSNLIANGWIDQQRRSKMRVVWKDVLASLVEGRRPGEETTLWIQRQVVDPATGKVTGLEALHQVPMKWLEDVNYVDIYGDHRFTLKVYNIAEEFYFRTRDEQSAQSWVLTLRSARDASLESMRMGNAGAAGHSKPSTKEVGGMGLNNLEDWDNNGVGKPGQQQQQPTSDETNNRPSSAPTETQSQTTPRLSISELRSIAHRAGYDTRGMERQDLERIAAMIRNQATTGTAQASTSPSSAQEQLEARAMAEAARCQKEVEELLKQEEEAKLRRAAELEQRRRREEEERKRQAEQQQAAEMRKKQEEAERQRQMEEHRRRQEEERQRQVEQQAAQIKQRQEEERRKRIAELQAAEMKRNEEERRKQQQQYYQQQQAHYQQQQQQAHFHQQQQQNPAHNQQFYNQNTQQGFSGNQQPQPPQPSHQQYYNQNAPSSGGYSQQGFQSHPPNNPQRPQPQQQPQPQQKQQHQAPPPSKYMEDTDDEAQSAAILKIKRNILIHWALQPPNLNVLRPIDQLITTIHTAMPPAYGISTHEYFSKFTPITRHEIFASDAMGNHPDETKLKKAVRKVRVFLHPDKLPRDLSAEQSFMARMLWDITSDSWEEFLKHKDELDWIRG